MQWIIICITLGISSVLGDISEYRPNTGRQAPDRALLVLPPQQAQQANATPQAVQDEEDNLEKLNANVMERLRQEIGSNTGVYYVYLPDGRLQRIQYTTAPIKQQDTQQQSEQEQRQSNGSQTEQYKQNGQQQGTSNQQSNTQVVFGTNKQTTQGNQQQQQYTDNRQQQARSYTGYQQYQQEQQTGGNPSQLLAQYNGPERLQNAAAPPSYIASVQFTDVPPIHGPVYAYQPSPLVRIVRYANNY
ncbi:hypothetical protein O3M35_004768 [Rhynocoris fuscipes]|uniref:Uncharacterized protein n=1 Tax=Rhynocoris fuscipes TaxID=488301 RepID=A0AAW1DII4_9HEMI